MILVVFLRSVPAFLAVACVEALKCLHPLHTSRSIFVKPQLELLEGENRLWAERATAELQLRCIKSIAAHRRRGDGRRPAREQLADGAVRAAASQILERAAVSDGYREGPRKAVPPRHIYFARPVP